MQIDHEAVIVGAGGAGLWAALELAAAGVSTAVLTKLYPTRSHTGAAQGGVCAALGNLEEDHWEWHMFDTVKGGDYLVDQDAAEVLAREAVECVIELEHMGLPFNRTPEGKIDQRRFGGHTRNFGEAPVRRACFAADRTGHMILQTLYQQCIKAGVVFYDEYHVVDLLFEGGDGGWAVERRASSRTGSPTASCTRSARGSPAGHGRVRADVPDHVERMVADRRRRVARLPPWHPACRTWSSTSSTRPASSASASCCPKPLAARAVTCSTIAASGSWSATHPSSRSLRRATWSAVPCYMEVREGRGIGGKDYVFLDVRHLGRKVIEEKLPDITDFARVYQGVEPITEPVPVQPTAHYAMGGIPTDIHTRVTRDEENTVVPGLYAAGEAACVSVHGANRLGTNSLVDLLVFGRRAGRQMARDVKGLSLPLLPADVEEPVRTELRALRDRPTGENASRIRSELADVMMDEVGVFRDQGTLNIALPKVRELQGAVRSGLRAGQGPRLQHGPARGPRGGLPARLRRDDGRFGTGPDREPGRPLP